MKTRKRLNYRFVACMLVAAAVFGVGVHFVHGYQVKRNASVLLRQADAAREEKDYAEEMQHLARYLGFEPDAIDARARLGEALYESAKEARSFRALASAFFQLDTVLRRDPTRSDVRRRQVDIAMAMGKFTDALAHLKILQDAAPQDAELEQLTGRCQEANGQFRDAVLAYELAIHHAPDTIENYLRVAVLSHERLDDAKKADRTMDSMVEANPKSFRAYLARAQYRLQFHAQSPGDVEKARDDVKQARQLAPDEPEVVLAAARVEQTQGKPEEVRKLLLQGIKAHPSDPRLYLALIAAEVGDNKAKDALALARQGLKEVSPEDARYGDLLHAKADLLVQSGEVKEAEETIARLREMKYAAAKLDYIQALIHVHEKEWSRAVALLERVRPQLARAPKLEVQTLLLMGQCYNQLGNPDEALQAYQHARKLDPLSTDVRYRLGTLLLNMGRHDEALAELRELFATAKKAVGLHAVLARALIVRNMRLPRRDRALREIRRELALVAKETPDAIDLPIMQAQALLLDDYKHLDTARRMLEKARDAHPDEITLWIACFQLAERGEALAILRRAADRPKLAKRVELPLARLSFLTQPLTEAKTPELRKKAEEDLRATLAQMEKESTTLAETDRPILLSGLAETYLRLGDNSAAERLWQRVAEQQPNNLIIRLVLFDLALRAKSVATQDRLLAEIHNIEGENGAYWRYAEASRRLQQARPADKEKLTESGRHKLQEARQYLVAAAKHRPSWSRISALEAEIDEIEGSIPAAIEKYQQALALGDRRPAIVRRLMDLLYEQRRLDEMNQTVHKLRDQGNTLVDAGLGKLLAMDLITKPDPSDPDPQRALLLAERSVTADSKAYQDHLWLGRIRWATAKPQEVPKAEKSLRRACELGASVPETWVTLVAFLVNTGKKKEAEQAIAEATKLLPPDQSHLALAACYENIGDLQKAEEHYQAMLKASPEDVRMLRNVAGFYLRRNQATKAEPRLRAILALDSSKLSPADVMWARRALAGILGASVYRSQFDEGLALVEKNLADNKDSAEDQHARALLVATRPSRRKEAIRLFKDLDRLSPLPANERFALVRLFLLEDNWLEAEQNMLILLNSPQGKNPTYEADYARRLLQHDNVAAAQAQLEKLEKALPDAPLTREIRARVLHAKGKDAEAVAVIREYAQGKDADLVRAAIFLETLAKAKGKGKEEPSVKKLYLDEAESMYRKHAAKSDKPERFLPLAEFLGRKHSLVEALACCNKALEHKASPDNVAPVMTGILRETHPADRYFRSVEQTLKDILTQKPDSIPVLICLAEVYNLQERFDDAEKLYRQGLSKKSDNIMLLNNLAWLLAFQKPSERQEALVAINKAIDLYGPSPELLDTRGVIYLKQNQKERALEDFRAASTLSRKASHTFHFASALAAADNLREARQTLEEANKRGFDVQTLHPLEKQAGLKLIAVLQPN